MQQTGTTGGNSLHPTKHWMAPNDDNIAVGLLARLKLALVYGRLSFGGSASSAGSTAPSQ